MGEEGIQIIEKVPVSDFFLHVIGRFGMELNSGFRGGD